MNPQLDPEGLSREARTAWEANAAWWVAQMRSGGDGDSFRRDVLNPAIEDALVDLGEPILDIGCGEGYLERLPFMAARSITGIDWSGSLIAAAAKSAAMSGDRVSYVVGDAATGIPAADGSFGGIVSNMAIMDIVGLAETFANAFRVTRPDGMGLWTVLNPTGVDSAPSSYFQVVRPEQRPISDSEWAAWVKIATDEPVPTLYIQRSVDTYKALFESAGWQVDDCTVYSAGTHPEAMLIRTRRKRAAR